MTDAELRDYLMERYRTHGIESLSYAFIKKEKGLYHHLYSRGYKVKHIIHILGLDDEYQQFKEDNFTKVCDGVVQKRWSWRRVIKTVTPIVEEQGFLPPAQWFNSNGFGSLVQYVYNSNKSWQELREHFGSFENSDFITSRNGMRWRSRPEASLSNFLYARGIEHKTGEKYPEEYANYGGSNYGYYDLHFRANSGAWIDVEIWGDKPKGHNEQGYAATRKAKEHFNESNNNFIGLHYSDCYEDKRLSVLLKKYIGTIEPFIFEKPEDEVIQTTHWTDADELIEYCKKIADSQPSGKFPTEEWLRKRGKWKDRDGPAYNTVSVYIKNWIGGVRQLREILGQSENSTSVWSRETAINEYMEWFEKYGFTTGQVRRHPQEVSVEERKKAQNITRAVEKYYGPVSKLNEHLNIDSPKITKWNAEYILKLASEIYEKYSLTPNQMANLDKKDQVLFGVTDDEIVLSRQMVDRLSSYFSGSKELYRKLDIRPVDKRTLRRQFLVNSISDE